MPCHYYPFLTSSTTMKKNKKKKDAKKPTLLGGAAKSLRKLGKGTTGRLSTTQKVVGGAALVALGLGYLSKRLKKAVPTPTPDAAAAEEQLAAMEETA
jgi:hypothetical protein